ncbi:hypothetical protein ZHAS_00012716 [Anopheles sinensis]|uniref:Uncharacterized protein n=1 Tax=Anopheles sinensis TaxID=74873 RepID=A0A084W3L3_ANOSI|nr:hypothetical protein ZHAS_00012716 [Anopheles sinensis]
MCCAHALALLVPILSHLGDDCDFILDHNLNFTEDNTGARFGMLRLAVIGLIGKILILSAPTMMAMIVRAY